MEYHYISKIECFISLFKVIRVYFCLFKSFRRRKHAKGSEINSFHFGHSMPLIILHFFGL